MRYHSENIKKIRHLLSFPKPFDPKAKMEDFDDILKDKILALLLVNADIATPILNKAVVTGLFEGKRGWPKKDGSELTITCPTDITVLENLGLISFYADYCVTHKGYIHREVEPHESVVPILDALSMISDIKHGEDVVNPHFHIQKNKAHQLMADNRLTLELESIDELSVCDDFYAIHLKNDGRDSLLSELLWKEFFPSNDIRDSNNEQRFKKWLLISNTYYWRYLTNINLEYLDAKSRSLFSELALSFIENDAELKKNRKQLEKQWACESGFEHLYQTVESTVQISINLSGENKSQETSYTVTANSLDKIKTTLNHKTLHNTSSDLECIKSWNVAALSGYPLFYDRYFNFPLNIVKSGVLIDDHGTIYDHEKLDKLLSFSEKRPLLQHILLNILPSDAGVDYLLFLLSRPETSHIATYLFVTNVDAGRYYLSRGDDYQHYQFFSLVCDELINVLFNSNNQQVSYDSLIELIILIAKDAIPHDYSQGNTVERYCLDVLLDRFLVEHVQEFASQLHNAVVEDNATTSPRPPTWKFYLLFWLLEKSQDRGLLASNSFPDNLQTSIVSIYTDTFKSSIDTKNYSYNARAIFDEMPWERVQGSYLDQLLDIIPSPTSWILKLASTSDYSYSNLRLVRNYLQVMLCIFIKSGNEQVLDKVTSLLEAIGFANGNQEYIGLFYLEDDRDYQLWERFLLVINSIDDKAFNRLFNVLKNHATIDKVFEAYKATNRGDRKEKILAYIKSIESSSLDKLGMTSLETSLNIACQTGELKLAEVFLEKGLSAINDENSFLSGIRRDYYFTDLKDKWSSFEYKVKLLGIVNNDSLLDDKKIKLIQDFNNPFNDKREYHIGHHLFENCDLFKRMMVSFVLSNKRPERAYSHSKQLYEETKGFQYASHFFYSKLLYLDNSKAVSEKYRQALLEWEDVMKDHALSQLGNSDIVNWFHCYNKTNSYQEADNLWQRLSHQQKHVTKIAHAYCEILNVQGANEAALSIGDSLKEYHGTSDLGSEMEEMLNSLNDSYTSNISTRYAISLSEKPQSDDRLRRSFHELSSKSITDIAKIITGNETTVSQFLYEHIFSILNELQLRKAHLNIQKNGEDYRIVNEDPINDWVVSLFNNRFSWLGLSCRDQARGGQSKSKIGVGEIDFFICGHHNQRISIMEAFKLSSYDTRVIKNHLNKIAGYDQECLSPVFILIYCDVKNFSNLFDNYVSNISEYEYEGFSLSNDGSPDIFNEGNIKVCQEVRYRYGKAIDIYHIMVNLRFDT